MKIKAIDRIFLILITLFVILLSVGSIMAVWKFVPEANILYTISQVIEHWQYAVIVTIGAFISLVIAIKLLFFRVRGKGVESRRPPSTILKATESGVASISYAALESMVLNQAKVNQCVRECKCMIDAQPEGTGIHLAVGVKPGTNLVELVSTLQQSIKENIELLTGLPVKEVSVMIESADAAPTV